MVFSPHLINLNARDVNMNGSSGMARTVLDVLMCSPSVNIVLTGMMSSSVMIAMELIILFIS